MSRPKAGLCINQSGPFAACHLFLDQGKLHDWHWEAYM
ncbi:hypothetical protein BRUCa_0043 [Brucella melitensis]